MIDLPYRFIVPLPVRASELLDFTVEEWRLLASKGMEIFDLPPGKVEEAFALKKAHPRLSANDCFCLVATQCHHNSILLTGDGTLRKVAATNGVRVHGVLWLIDRLIAERTCTLELIVSALQIWRADRTVFLPDKEIEARLRRLES